MCLSVWNRSPQAYKELQGSGMVVLPSGRLLQMYKNCIRQNPGMNHEVFDLMQKEALKWKIPASGYRGGIMLDEMSIQEDLQLKEENGLMKLVGLVDLGQEDSSMITIRKGTKFINFYLSFASLSLIVLHKHFLRIRLEGGFSLGKEYMHLHA